VRYYEIAPKPGFFARPFPAPGVTCPRARRPEADGLRGVSDPQGPPAAGRPSPLLVPVFARRLATPATWCTLGVKPPKTPMALGNRPSGRPPGSIGTSAIPGGGRPPPPGAPIVVIPHPKKSPMAISDKRHPN
jgi:hypothetical protein